MEYTKNVETNLIGESNEVIQTVNSFEGGYEIWLSPIYEQDNLREGLASDFYDVGGIYDTFEDVLKDALNLPEEAFETFVVMIRQYFSIYDEDMGGYDSICVDLLEINSDKTLTISDEILSIRDTHKTYEEDDE